MFALENATFACGVRIARERSFEEASGETEVGRRLLLAPDPRPLPPLALAPAPQTRPTGTQTDSQLEPVTSAGVILPETGQFLLLCSLQLWQQLQRCRQTRARVGLPLCLIHYTPVLRKQFAANDMFLREANSYKRALALRNCRREMLADAAFAARQFARCSQLPTQSADDVCRLISSKSSRMSAWHICLMHALVTVFHDPAGV